MAQQCNIDGCAKAAHCRGMCPMHYQRWRIKGDPGPAASSKGKNEGPCSVDGCGQPMRKTGLCAAHYSQKRTTGKATPFKYKWAEPGGKCAVCGDPAGKAYGLRKYCSETCKVTARLYPAGRARSISCAGCGEPVDLMLRPDGARRSPATRRLCGPCRKRSAGRHGRIVWDLADRDGTNCSICSDPVDMSLKRPESLFGPSVDHVLPRSRGGADDMSNYALAHYWCNAVKSDRVGFLI